MAICFREKSECEYQEDQAKEIKIVSLEIGGGKWKLKRTFFGDVFL